MSYSKDSGVDYKVEDVTPDRGIGLLFWHKALYVILVIVILASLATIVFQMIQIRNLEKDKGQLIDEKTILQADIATLQATVEALQQPEATRTPQ